ncbi:hypothetical protein SY83_07100 [Paenibacillus swuensis]|uniref:NAD-dependent epimerase/dehydratase domain-containing protein n=1 Tax=Paenibacillus swuensis TaxID=1178515 RepID=A0A172TGA7_9BACL|nr:NAD-dependent epimerase/dehydratase family protein [Paenibacillus swuensis]ANE46088.1 hypothetical protein SY83_07100 [Paenibacillus swuensis]
MSARLLITGGGGFTGRHACEHFIRRGVQVVPAVRRKSGLAHEVICDLSRAEETSALLGEVRPDFVLHLAGRNAVPDSWADPAGHLETNLMSTVYVLEAVRRHVPQARVLVVGSMLASPLGGKPEPPHPYALSKSFQRAASLAWGHLYQLKLCVAQPSNLIGPGNSAGLCGLIGRRIAALEKGGDPTPFRLSSRTETRDFLDVRDAVNAYETILLHGVTGHTYAVASGLSRSLGDIADGFTALAKVPLPFEVSSPAAGADSNPGAARPVLEIDTASLRQLGWSPQIPLAQSLTDILNYYRHH